MAATNPSDAGADELKRIAEAIGTRENALFFQSKVSDAGAKDCGSRLLRRFGFVNGVNSSWNNFDGMSDSEVASWSVRCWANTVAHLYETDMAVRMTIRKYRTILPVAAAGYELLLTKVHEAFGFFLWVLAGPTNPLTAENYCRIKLIVLKDVLLLEQIEAQRDGRFGGWGLLDKTIAGLREMGAIFGISQIKAIATNERIYRAFLRRGFHDRVPVNGLTCSGTGYSKRVELSWDRDQPD